MKTNVILAVTPALLAIAAFLLSFGSTNASAWFAGLTCVLGTVAVLALDYRISWKSLIGR